MVLIWCAFSGSTASFLIALIVGAITKIVRNRAIPTSTWLGGALFVPTARADEAEHDQDAAEAGDREEDRRHERQPADSSRI